jgi:hypothetical protein
MTSGNFFQYRARISSFSSLDLDLSSRLIDRADQSFISTVTVIWAGERFHISESNWDYALGRFVILRVAGYFVVEPSFGNQIAHTLCRGFACGHQKAEGKTPHDSLNPTFLCQKSPSLPGEVNIALTVKGP